MKKKLTALAMVLVLGATAAIGGTLAYFTDTDSAKNVMTTGGVDIEQNEYQRGDNGLEPFEQDKPLMPRVDAEPITENNLFVDGYFNPAMKNVVDKIVTVTNTATGDNSAAYVRTILAFETAAEYVEDTDTVLRDARTIFDTYIGVLGKGLTWADGTYTIDGKEYVIAYKVYADPLAAGATTAEPSLKQIFLSPDADNEVAKLFGDSYTVLALSQGTQVEGFDEVGGATVALDTAFGEVEDAANIAKWFEGMATE